MLVVGDDYEQLAAEASDELEAAPTTKDDVAIWKFTTGSTGLPKAAVHPTHSALLSFDWYARGVLDLREDDLVLPVPKLFFGYARDLAALFPFGVGAAGIVFPERTTPERIFELVERHRPTILVQVPTMMAAMLAHPDAAEHDLSCLRLCTSAGEALPRELYERWRTTFGVEVLDGIGSSEAYHIYISNRPGRVRPGSTGELVPGYERAASTRPASSRSRATPPRSCYWNEHEKSKATFSGDTVRTGDLFERDEDGFFWYRGRADDLIKVGGIWVAPAEIEDCLLAHPDVIECAVVGHEEDGLTQSLRASSSCAGRARRVGAAGLRARARSRRTRSRARSASSTSCRRRPRARSTAGRCAHEDGRRHRRHEGDRQGDRRALRGRGRPRGRRRARDLRRDRRGAGRPRSSTRSARSTCS